MIVCNLTAELGERFADGRSAGAIIPEVIIRVNNYHVKTIQLTGYVHPVDAEEVINQVVAEWLNNMSAAADSIIEGNT